MEAVLDLKDGKSDPEKEMTFCEKDTDGLPIYCLVRGRWRGLYRVDKAQSACDAISIDEMNSFVRVHQGLRRLFVWRIDR
jgi:hypothetical protein